MAKSVLEFCFKVEDRPGILASIAEVFAKEGININGCTAIKCDNKGMICLITNNSQGAASALKKAGIKHETHELFEVSIQDKPGELARLTKALADEKVNVTVAYITMRKTIVLGVDNVAAATKVFQKQ